MKHSSGVYVMQVAAMLTGLHPQTLRKYEKFGLVTPDRMNTLRLYSEEDIALCCKIRHLMDELGLNLAGVELSLKIRHKLLELKEQIADDEQANRKQYLTLINEMLEMLGDQ